MIRPLGIDAILSGSLDPSQLKVYKQWDRNFDFLISEGPAWVVGDSATVTFRLYTNKQAEYRQMTPEEFLAKIIHYSPWLPEDHFYYADSYTISEKQLRYPKIPPLSEMITVEDMAEDKSSFTLTFREPGRYLMFEYYCTSFYLISPDQEEPAAMAAEMDAVVEKAKAAATEKQGAKILYNWIHSKVKYNYDARGWWDTNMDARDAMTSGEPIGALIYGKCVCGGYAMIYSILMQQAGFLQFPENGLVQPGDEGHAWNINRLDGVWSWTDVTWSRFDWTRERMGKDHEPLHWLIDQTIFSQSGFDLLADQAEEDYKPLSVLPLALKHLPLNAADYGFPEISEKDLISAELTPLGQKIRITLDKAAKVRISKWKDGKMVGIAEESEKAVKEYTARFTSQNSLLVELLTYDRLPKPSRPAVCTILYYTDGELTGTGARYVFPLKNNEYPGYDNYSYRYFEYDGQMKPLVACWHLVFEGGSLDLKVYFGADGNAERYAVNYSSYLDSVKTSWEALADGTLTELGGKPVEDPLRESPTLWEPVWFE